MLDTIKQSVWDPVNKYKLQISARRITSKCTFKTLCRQCKLSEKLGNNTCIKISVYEKSLVGDF